MNNSIYKVLSLTVHLVSIRKSLRFIWYFKNLINKVQIKPQYYFNIVEQLCCMFKKSHLKKNNNNIKVETLRKLLSMKIVTTNNK